METQTEVVIPQTEPAQAKSEYRFVRRGRGANTHMVPLKRRKGKGRRSLKN